MSFWITSAVILATASQVTRPMPRVSDSGLTVRQLYNGIQRPLLVNVESTLARANLEIKLLAPVSATVEGSSKVTPGLTDLAKIFPELWTTKTPHVQYAQLYVNGKATGSAIVLQPMLNPVLSRLKADGKTLEFVPDEDGPMYNGIRAYADQHLIIETSLGNMEFRLRPDAAPNTTFIIRGLAEGGFYTGSIFHRVVPKRKDGSPFVIQGGDPTGTGSGGPGFAYPLEKSALVHDFGVLSIARSTDPNTNGGQFFVGLSREGTKHLDEKYAAFAELVKGADVVIKIAAVPIDKNDRPLDPPRIRQVRLIPAPAYGTGPAPMLRPKA